MTVCQSIDKQLNTLSKDVEMPPALSVTSPRNESDKQMISTVLVCVQHAKREFSIR